MTMGRRFAGLVAIACLMGGTLSALGGVSDHVSEITVEQGLDRKKLRDRFEREETAFHQRVRQGYLEMAKREPGRWLAIDASLPRKEITRLIWERFFRSGGLSL